uniref:EF-hand domain-containing protein n=1 Tax=Gasterosteus aculeatus aculeatus TaxID=481459 RepID=A0AAQ4QGS4_GASAC
MATQTQQSPHLHLAEITAAQFIDIWKHFDADGNGYIEGKELENFFKELETARRGAGQAWRRYDTDRSGYIESNELKGFLLDLLKKANRNYDDKKLNEYTQTILRMFDLNGDGKLGLSEMARLLPVQENFLLKFEGISITVKEFDSLFTLYDKDGNGYIDEQELDALLKDLCDKNKMDVDPLDTEGLLGYKKSIMALSDGGKMYRTELEIVLCRDSTL